VQEVAYERVLPTHNAATLQASTEFNFVIPPRTDYFTRFKIPYPLKKMKNRKIFHALFFSFNSDYQMVIDAQIVVASSTQAGGAQDNELLYPPRHQITLPLNNLNILFENIETAFNQTTKLSADK
jgi:hypothetical protein